MTAHLSVHDLIDNVSQLESGEFDAFFRQVLSLRAKRVAPVLPNEESVLLKKIYNKLPAQTQKRYDLLTKKRQDGSIQPTEHQELLELVTVFEKHNVERLASIIELANLRNVTAQELMKQLGLMPMHSA